MKKAVVSLIIFTLVTVLTGEEPISRELLSLLQNRTTDQIMMALEPAMKMEKKEFYKIFGASDGANINSFSLHIGASCKENAKPNERFYASYFTPIALTVYRYTICSYIISMYDVTGKGSTPHAALVDMVKQLVERNIIDSRWLRKNLARI